MELYANSKNEKMWTVLPVRLTLILTVIALTPSKLAADQGSIPNDNRLQLCPRDPRMDPTYEVHHGQDVVWQIPTNPVAILFMAHGGKADPLSFFDRGPKCERCYGRPEDRLVVLEALERGYAVIATKSIGEIFIAWPLEASQDLVIAVSVINNWRSEHSLQSLPLAAWGHSAGGFFVTSLSLMLPIRALVLMCSEGQLEVEENATAVHFPPTFFAYMPVDNHKGGLDISTRAAKAIAILRGQGVQVAEKQCWPKPLSPLFFTERVRCMPNETSEKIYRAFKAEGWLDSEGYLTKNPEAEDWRAVLWKWRALSFCKESGDFCLAVHVQQELQMAYAEHSLTSDANKEIYPWLESKVLSLDHSVTPLVSSQ